MMIEFLEDFDIPSSTPQQRGMSKAGNYPRQGLRYARAAWMALLEKHRPEKPLEGPVILEVQLFYHASKKQLDGKYKTTRPDGVNILKLIEDSMTKCGYWNDDSQVQESIRRFWTSEGSKVFVRIKGEDDE